MKAQLALNNKKILASGTDPEQIELELLMYGDVGGWGIDAASLCNQIQQSKADTITVRINSYGGDTATGLAICNYLRSEKRPVTAVIDGIAASAASIIACGASTVIMPAGSLMMIHQCWTVAAGNSDDMLKTADTLAKIDDAIVSIYSQRTGKSADEIKALMQAETWLSPEEAVELGLADICESSLDVAASIDASDLDAKMQAKLQDKLAALTAAADAKQQKPADAAKPAEEKPVDKTELTLADWQAKAQESLNNAENQMRLKDDALQALDTIKAKYDSVKVTLADYQTKAIIDANNAAAKIASLTLELDKYRASVASFSTTETASQLTGIEAYRAKMRAKYNK
ncbi:MAG: head maturation protease, ClpP-related [Sulfuriferula sp.]